MEKAKKLSDCCFQFALGLLQGSGIDRMSNVVVSPFCIGDFLLMLYAGAEDATKEDLKKALHLQGFVDDSAVHKASDTLLKYLKGAQNTDTRLGVASRFYFKSDTALSNDFNTLLRTHYATDIELVPFEEGTIKSINDWVAQSTSGKIGDLIVETDALARFVIISAVCFEGKWKREFHLIEMEPAKFLLDDTTELDVDMMTTCGKFYAGKSADLKCDILRLPYKTTRFAMFILLPWDLDGLERLEGSLTTESLKTLQATMTKKPLEVKLPKFKMEWGMNLNDPLASLGLSRIFSESDANFSVISQDSPLFVSSIVHRCYLEVDEKGTKAAAAIGSFAPVCLTSPEAPPVFNVNHPFLLLIQEANTSCVLFLGRITNPKQ